MGFRFVPKSMILNDLARCNGRYFVLFRWIRYVSWPVSYKQGRIMHCAGCTMGGGPVAKRPPPISCQIFYHTLFWCLNVQCIRLNVTTTKKGRQLFCRKKCTAADKKILVSLTRKGPPPYVGMGPPEWLIRPCVYKWLISCWSVVCYPINVIKYTN